MLDPRLSHEALSMGASLAGLPLADPAARCVELGDTTLERLAALLWSPAPRSSYEDDVVAAALKKYLADQGMAYPVATSEHLPGSDT